MTIIRPLTTTRMRWRSVARAVTDGVLAQTPLQPRPQRPGAESRALALGGGLAALPAGRGLLSLRAALAGVGVALPAARRLAALLGGVRVVRDRGGPLLAH